MEKIIKTMLRTLGAQQYHNPFFSKKNQNILNNFQNNAYAKTGQSGR